MSRATQGARPNGAKGKASLERSLGFVTATLLTTGMIIGTGIFGAIGAASVKAGSGIPLAIILGGLVALATGLSAAQLGINFPEEGGAFTWARKFHRGTLGFVAGCAYLGKGTLSLGVISLAFATYSTQVVPFLPIHIVAFAVIFGIIDMRSSSWGWPRPPWYSSSIYPPTSGLHWPSPAPWRVFEQEVPPETWVHNLEHGGIVILYHCGTPCPDLGRQLRDVYATFPGSKYGHVKVLVTPASKLKTRLAILAWRWIDELNAFDLAGLLRFYRAHVDQGPEDIP